MALSSREPLRMAKKDSFRLTFRVTGEAETTGKSSRVRSHDTAIIG